MAQDIWGDSGQIPVAPSSGAKELKNYLNGLYLGQKVRAITFYAPDGTDPGIAANTATIYVGPNGTAGFPLGPGGVLTLEDVDVGRVAFDNKSGAAGQIIFYAYGGNPPGV